MPSELCLESCVDFFFIYLRICLNYSHTFYTASPSKIHSGTSLLTPSNFCFVFVTSFGNFFYFFFRKFHGQLPGQFI